MAAFESLQARRAALLMHGLSAQQRRLVMAKLSAAETSRLEPMLNELASIGIPRELASGSDEVATAPEHRPETPAKESVPREPTPVQRVAQLEAESVLRALETSSPATIGHLLRSYDWPWKAEVLERLPEPRRTKALDTAQARLQPLAPAALTFLCTRLCSEASRAAILPRLDSTLRANLPRGSTPSVRSRFKRWVGWNR